MKTPPNALLLNADFMPTQFFPLSQLSFQDAIKGVYLEKLTVVSEYDIIVRSPSVEMFAPSVVALKEYVRPDLRVPFTRYNVFLRDRFRCQYCGERHELTFDHVIPRSKGGKTGWTNIVAACLSCNLKKGNRTDIKPVVMPVEPNAMQMFKLGLKYPKGYLHQSWIDYLYYDVEIEED